MKMSKILININNLKEIEEYKKIGITNFLFAIPKYSIGYSVIAIEDIPKDSYLLINRIMDSDTVDDLKKDKDKLCQFKGIFYEDIAVYNIFKNTDVELIWYQNHFTTNYESINFWLDNGCNSAVVSNEITQEEIKSIISLAYKPLVLTILAKNQIMYSRRTLLSNFQKYNNLPSDNDIVLVPNKTNRFLAHEEEYGTIIYNDTYFNYCHLINELDDNNIKFYLILNIDLDIQIIKDILDGKDFGNDGFLNKKTVYRMSEYDDR